jgi:hypothetical protein
VTIKQCSAIDKGAMQGIGDFWLRSEEPLRWFQHLAAGQPSYDLSEFVQSMTEKGACDYHGRAAYVTSSDGCIAFICRSSGLVAALRDTSGMQLFNSPNYILH